MSNGNGSEGQLQLVGVNKQEVKCEYFERKKLETPVAVVAQMKCKLPKINPENQRY